MYHFLQGQGFFGNHAPRGSDISLIVMLAAAVMFTIGWGLVRRGRVQAHRWVQTAAVCLNASLVILWMIRFFYLYVAPALPGDLTKKTYAVTTVHAAVGAVGLVLGVFVALRGNELVPRALKFRDYKPWMRTSYAVYMLATALGVAVYFIVYGVGR